MTSKIEHTRFKDAPYFQYLINEGKGKYDHALIGGVGGIGSWVAFFLARMGLHLSIYDMDTVDPTNIAGQFYKLKDQGELKTQALYNSLQEFCNMNDQYVVQFKEYGREANNIGSLPVMFSCFDNMKARHEMFQAFKQQEIGNSIFIDGRLTPDIMEVFVILNEKQREEYEAIHLHSDDVIPDLPCTNAQSTFMAAGIASKMVRYFTNFLRNKQMGQEVFAVPFHDYENVLI